jgi:hypothetical protein
MSWLKSVLDNLGFNSYVKAKEAIHTPKVDKLDVGVEAASAEEAKLEVQSAQENLDTVQKEIVEKPLLKPDLVKLCIEAGLGTKTALNKKKKADLIKLLEGANQA